MIQENLDKVLALAEELPQTTECLKRGDSFCTLGFILEAYRRETSSFEWRPSTAYDYDVPSDDNAKVEALNWLGLHESVEGTIIRLNDDALMPTGLILQLGDIYQFSFDMDPA